MQLEDVMGEAEEEGLPSSALGQEKEQTDPGRAKPQPWDLRAVCSGYEDMRDYVFLLSF